MNELVMFVPGRPAPQGSKRHVGNGVMVESSKAVGPWRTVVAWHAAQVWRQPPLDGPVQVWVGFVMPRPVSTPKRATPPAVKKPDADKLIRAVLDALSGICWRDDAQVVDLHVSKRIAELNDQPGALIEIRPFLATSPVPSPSECPENSRALPSGPGIGNESGAA